ncbi:MULTISPECIES: hypothetical protein [Thermomonospora]|uniref:Uncharacterized protein n=1 Tax=Thermomonospora curvata (strain ATCC 19995 / DSM 43183 / JCM 3096 / KCTC 9072 / NBRC 15933 / NCIMB 10081 / Henssen B9) TaxID=471852 RepID=D1AEZ2_THECD|nr:MULTISPECIES: hypothetical protein [Thermomonospora]ACY99536.1 hypothetical protein Tcur_4007 [Thermomonospora curvata DSM 43183]PKK12576.1 MAG: hypothetical protein BUE48_019680 [Thermomonospora sp. CIF 1]
MSCDHMICGRCSHPVSEGRCRSCRQFRDELHGYGVVVPSTMLLAVLLLLLALALTLRLSTLG